MSRELPVVAGVELGGTKCIAVIARGRQILHRAQWPTGDSPDETLGALSAWLSDAARDNPFSALGIASFGPLRLAPAAPDYGCIVNTPKPGWSNANVVAGIAGDFDGPISLDTDVAGAALAEGMWGASTGCAVHVYLTIGTGIGGGIVIDGKPLHGAFHPELGHVRVRRAAGDDFAGICPFHGDCLEGLASGPAIAARAGGRAETLKPDDPLWQLVARDIAELMGSLILTMSPQRIVIGGGVGQGQPGLLAEVRRATVDVLGGYLPGHGAAEMAELIVPAALGGDAGVYGAIALALAALDA